MGPKIGKPTQLMDWITAGIKRGPYMLRIALPFPGHVPSAHRLAWLARRQQQAAPGLAPFCWLPPPGTWWDGTEYFHASGVRPEVHVAHP